MEPYDKQRALPHFQPAARQQAAVERLIELGSTLDAASPRLEHVLTTLRHVAAHVGADAHERSGTQQRLATLLAERGRADAPSSFSGFKISKLSAAHSSSPRVQRESARRRLSVVYIQPRSVTC
jgi:hypothetical protein